MNIQRSNKKGVKMVEGAGVGTIYFFSSTLDQDKDNTSKVVDDKDALSIAEQFDKKCDSSSDNAGQVIVDLARGGRLKSGHDRSRYSVIRKGVVFWIEP